MGSRRKRRRRKVRRGARGPVAAEGSAGIQADLRDQEAWSSYGQAVPRAGDQYRSWIWSQRNYRVFSSRRLWATFALALAGVLILIAILGLVSHG